MFSRIFIERPRFAAVISVVMVLAGIIFCTKLPVAEYPEIAPPTLYVSATYSGASSDVVATTVAMVLEDAINSVDGLLYYNSDSTNNGTYSCQVTFESGTDTDMAQVNLQNAVKRAEAKLPEDVKKIGISVEKRGGMDRISEATVKLKVGDEESLVAAESSSGPVNALDTALRKALVPFYPELKGMSLLDYKVRILSGDNGTAAKTRVLIESGAPGKSSWVTVGVSENIIDASYEALVDSVEYALLMHRKNEK